MEKLKPNKHQDFIEPLTKRGFLYWKASNRINFDIKSGDGELDYPLLIISTLLYLYGAEIVHIHTGNSKASKEKNMTRDKNLSPHIMFRYKDKPLYKRDGEYGLSKKLLEERKYNYWYPFQWITTEGDEIRDAYKKNENQKKVLKSFLSWEKKDKDLVKLVEKWQEDFSKNRHQDKQYSLKFYSYDSCYSLQFMKNTDGKTVEENKKENEIKLTHFENFALYLFKGFIESDKKFPKCKYE